MKVVFETTEYAFPIRVDMLASGKFKVTYGQQVRSGLSYGQAAHDLGECIFHALQCDGKLDRDARMGGSWSSRDPKETVVIQTRATAKAALIAAGVRSPAGTEGQ